MKLVWNVVFLLRSTANTKTKSSNYYNGSHTLKLISIPNRIILELIKDRYVVYGTKDCLSNNVLIQLGLILSV